MICLGRVLLLWAPKTSLKNDHPLMRAESLIMLTTIIYTTALVESSMPDTRKHFNNKGCHNDNKEK